ncbi:EHN domain-containing protein [Mycena chlorophos]|uniref:EHN domain-containing protein n=1 Tax=Mycena chlorophos TaxID=658473 RepID=A0A8H6TCG0_MYCCL|nr:EHN domain-containing protein [Mycena chlorophos]
MAEQPFKISVSNDAVARLKAKLDLVDFPDELDDAGWAYGAPLADIKRLVARWKDGYDWRKHEKALNDELPQFTRDIDVDGFGTLNIHYVHLRSDADDAIPLLFVHGWPGSFFEVRKLAPFLVKGSPDQPKFHVVALSLPGYGFSEAPKKRGFQTAQYAEVGHKVMLALGYSQYVTQGGDWGGLICRKIAYMYGPTHVKAWHTNLPAAGPPEFSLNPWRLLTSASMILALAWMSKEDKTALQRTMEVDRTGRGYFRIQATKPQTLGYSLADSPVGLLAWIYEKLVGWTDDYPWDDDEILTWVSIYAFSRAGPAASVRIYYETSQEKDLMSAHTGCPTVPMGVSFFPKEIISLPRNWVRRMGNVVFESTQTAGGHFAAYEVPELLAGDLRKMFGKSGPAEVAVADLRN